MLNHLELQWDQKIWYTGIIWSFNGIKKYDILESFGASMGSKNMIYWNHLELQWDQKIWYTLMGSIAIQVSLLMANSPLPNPHNSVWAGISAACPAFSGLIHSTSSDLSRVSLKLPHAKVTLRILVTLKLIECKTKGAIYTTIFS